MNRRTFLTLSGGLGYGICLLQSAHGATITEQNPGVTALHKPAEEWEKLLVPERYRILFEAGTEPSGSSVLNHEKRQGTFICAACFLPLFPSHTKYNSGTGWPSFWKPMQPDHIATKRDFKLIFPRTEYHCARCGGHQGHVFKDGPQPTGFRYCNNGLALEFIPEEKPLPELRA